MLIVRLMRRKKNLCIRESTVGINNLSRRVSVPYGIDERVSMTAIENFTPSAVITAEQDRLLSVLQARERLGVSHTTIYALFKDGSLPSLHIGRSRKVRLSAVMAFMDRAGR